MAKMIRWMLTIARIEWRNICANKSRNVFVGLLIAIPIAGIVAGSNLAFIAEPTPEERVTSGVGEADLHIDAYIELDKLRKFVPPGSTIEPISFGRELVSANGLRISVETIRLNPEGLARGMYELTEGRWPNAAGEIVASIPCLDWIDKQVGESVEFSGGRLCEVVGVFENPANLNQFAVIYPFVRDCYVGETEYLVAFPRTQDLASRFSATGQSEINAVIANLDRHILSTRDDLIQTQPSLISIAFVLGMLALAEAALIIMSAFIVGVRRRQREIGLMSACGATNLQVLCSVVLSATIVSAIAAMIGCAVGIAVTMGAVPWLDELNGRRNGGFEWTLQVYILAVLFGIVVALMSSLLPAMGAARLPIGFALSSRRPPDRSAGRIAMLGCFALAAGVWLVCRTPYLLANQADNSENQAMQSVIFGSILSLVGFGAMSPWLLRFASRFGARLPLSLRLAVRECGRFCIRNGPIVTAILAGTALSVTTAAFYRSITQMDEVVLDIYRPSQLLVVGPASEQVSADIASTFDAVRAAIKCAHKENQLLTAKEPADRSFNAFRILVGDAELLASLDIDDSNGEILGQMNQGQLLRLTDAIDGDVTLLEAESRDLVTTLPSFTVESASRTGIYGYVISTTAMEKLGFQSLDESRREITWLVQLPRDLQEADRVVARSIAARFPQTTVETKADFKVDRSNIWGVFVVSILTGLVLVATASALAHSESRADARILGIVGAPPKVNWNVAAARSTYLSLVGCLLAIPVGLLPAYGIAFMFPQFHFVIPFSDILIVVVGLPLLAFVASWISARLMSTSAI